MEDEEDVPEIPEWVKVLVITEADYDRRSTAYHQRYVERLQQYYAHPSPELAVAIMEEARRNHEETQAHYAATSTLSWERGEETDLYRRYKRASKIVERLSMEQDTLRRRRRAALNAYRKGIGLDQD